MFIETSETKASSSVGAPFSARCAAGNETMLLNVFGQIPLVILDLKPSQKFGEFVPESRFSMAVFLVLDIPNHGGELRMGAGERAESFLPAKTPGKPMMTVNMVG